MTTPELLTDSQQRSLKELRSQRTRWLSIVVGIVFIGLLFFGLSKDNSDTSNHFASTKERLQLSGIADLQRIVWQLNNYQLWLYNSAPTFSLKIFEATSARILMVSLKVNELISETGSVNQFILAITVALIRITFLISATIHIWLGAILLGLIYQFINFRTYGGHDILGQTGNGRLFFSGVRLKLGKDGRNPEGLVRGLACPKQVSTSKAQSSKLVELLKKYKALNNTNLELVSILLAYPDCPGYISNSIVDQKNTKTVGRVSLIDFTAEKLQSTLAFRFDTKENLGNEFENNLNQILGKPLLDKFLSLSTAEIATLVLSQQSGKVLCYVKNRNTWESKSSYPQLAARAVLHATENFAKDYNARQRARLRQALIYSERHGAFGPVALPADMPQSSQALRTLAEYLAIDPLQPDIKLMQLEFFTRCWELEQAAKELLPKMLESENADLFDDCYYSTQGLLFIPLERLLPVIQKIAGNTNLKRLAELQKELFQYERKVEIETRDQGQESFRSQDRTIAAPLNDLKLHQLAQMHNLSSEGLKYWSTARVFLQAYGWLAQKIGHHSMPESGLVLGLAKDQSSEVSPIKNKSIGLRGLVGLRYSKFENLLSFQQKKRLKLIAELLPVDNLDDYNKVIVAGASRAELDKREQKNLIG